MVLLMRVVASATGYPADVLGLDRDVEAELGIDSIKRIEIVEISDMWQNGNHNAYARMRLSGRDLIECKRVLGDVKRDSSRAVGHVLPGKIWARGGEPKPVRNRSHQLNAMKYILFDQGESAWTWSFRDANDEGRFGRSRGSAPG